MSHQNHKEYFEIFRDAILLAILIVLILLLAGCKLLQQKEVQKSDSTSVRKDLSEGIKVDSSKSKSESVNTKETVYYPQPIIVPGKDGETKVVFVPQTTRESGTTKTEDYSYKFDEFKKELLDSLNKKESEKKVETKVKVFDFWQILALGVLGIFLFKDVFLKLRSKIFQTK